ncbi:hydantoinase B/oxoprolinase family protein [Achromobacter sp. GG226]|uniref:hydantoinase B/oxoprolinase family protein n=1 Tax=Verticiella alkaliphila TaxID=2779529 RepID=UPI001C0B26F4|nr:hydantoinase B/oxoprolinase family protein [Verticiella sp. GG226]MBU4609551.1 hydantoinase B/oxoprolinase family protein [Verticiella sp. GG226]
MMAAAAREGERSCAGVVDIAIDVGGTFVDVAVQGPAGLATAKYPRVPGSAAQAVLSALDAMARQRGITPSRVRRLLHGSTIATNILLERSAAPVGMIVTRGFADVLTLGRQDRRDLYRSAILPQTPAELAPEAWRCEIAGRLDAQGAVQEAVVRAEVQAAARRLWEAGARSVAVCLLFAHVNSDQERQVRDWVHAVAPGLAVSLSSEVDPRPREYERWLSTVLDAYVKPGVAGYLMALSEGLAERGYPPVLMMRSLGGVAPVAVCLETPVSLAMSGPVAAALGVASMLDTSASAGAVVSVDIGGTTADLALLREGGVTHTQTLDVGELSLRMHSVDITSIAVGGGSLARVDSAGGILIGPDSVGANPGPAAYGRGGQRATLTDCLVVLGMAPDRLAGEVRLDVAGAERAVQRDLADPLGVGVREAARAALDVANAMLAEAIKAVAIGAGLDPRAVTVVAAGGGGGLHVAEAAARAGVARVLVPALPGVAAAIGLLHSPLTRVAEHTLDVALDAAGLAAARAAAGNLVLAPCLADLYPRVDAQWFLDMGYEGQAFSLAVPVHWERDTVADLRARFDDTHRQVRGQVFSAAQRLRGLRWVLAQGLEASPSPDWMTPGGLRKAERADATRDGADAAVEWYRADLAVGQTGKGPARILASDTTIWVPPGWQWRVAQDGTLAMTAAVSVQAVDVDGTAGLDVLRLRLEGIAERMQQALVRSAVSSVAREGMDCAAALFLADGRILAQARSLPLLLGSLIPAVAGILRVFPVSSMAEGDAYLLNDPWSGGTHLPDIVMLRPVVRQGVVVAFATSILHHQDIGGSAPGSVPPDALDIYQEGLRIPPVRWRARGVVDPGLAALLTANSRTPENLLGDLDAQWAAVSLGVRELLAMLEERPTDDLAQVGAALMDRAERMTRAALLALPDGEFTHADALDALATGEPARLCVRVHKQGECITLDFTGTSPQVRAPLNAPPAAMLSAAFFFMRTFAPAAPNNHGCLAPLTLQLPPGSLVNPALPAPVNARTATVKLACNALLAAWAQADPERAVAANAGVAVVMSVGGEDDAGRPFFFTEIVAGGAGAHAAGPGVSGVSTDVGNARNLPAEMLEAQAPIRVECHARHVASGGVGRHAGGDGVLRRYLLLEGRATVSYRGERHEGRAAGAAGGSAGSSSRAWLERADGSRIDIASKARFGWQAGERLVIATAGGGGWGDIQDLSHSTSVLSGSHS